MSTKKTVDFMEVYQLDSNDNAHTLTPGFWTKLFNHLSSALPEDRQSTYKSNVLYGECRSVCGRVNIALTSDLARFDLLRE